MNNVIHHVYASSHADLSSRSISVSLWHNVTFNPAKLAVQNNIATNY